MGVNKREKRILLSLCSSGCLHWKVLGLSIMLSLHIVHTGAFSFVNTPRNDIHRIQRRTFTQTMLYSLDPPQEEASEPSSSSSSSSSGGTYRRFATYAWDKVLSSGLGIEETSVPRHLAANSCPNRGGGTVDIEIKSASPSSSSSSSSLRCVRYALLETLDDETNRSGIQVLNLVLFPQSHLPLPVLGMDLVSLPGNKHLIAIDFQPILPPTSKTKNNDESGSESETETESESSTFQLFPSQSYAPYEKRIKDIYEHHVSSQQDVIPWGGDIPEKASRFFSPYALWTRLTSENNDENLAIIDSIIYDAFGAYFDLYLELLLEANSNGNASEGGDDDASMDTDSISLEGHRDYLNYRRDNDPARPMLNRLYGQEYTEDVISNVLFQMI